MSEIKQLLAIRELVMNSMEIDSQLRMRLVIEIDNELDRLEGDTCA